MPITNELKKAVLEAIKQKVVLLEKVRIRVASASTEETAEMELRNRYLKVQEEARRGYANGKYPSQRLIVIDGRTYWLKLDGSVQDEIVREMEIEN